MKKVTTIITKDYEATTIYAWVDDKTALMLEQVDEQTRREYIVSEHEFYLKNRKEMRRHVSFEECLEKGITFSLELVSFEDKQIETELQGDLKKAISVLSEKERLIVTEVYFQGRTRRDVAKELGVTEVAVGSRLKRILEKIKKILSSDV